MIAAFEQRGTPSAPRVPFAETDASVLLDLVRGLAAVIVLLEHWRNIFFLDYPQLTGHRAVFAPFYLLCAAGNQAVIIFFVLSGYLIGGSVFRMLERGAWSWKTYLTHRLVRLWIVLVPGLLLCALWDGLGLRMGLAPAMYHGRSVNHMVGDVAANYTLGTFGANLIFLQHIRAAAFGSDGPLWSLAYEFWYYMLFPLGLFAVRARTAVPVRAASAMLFAAAAWLVGAQVMAMFPIWLFGTALAMLPAPKLKRSARRACGLLYLPIFFALGRRLPLPLLLVEYTLGAATVGLLWVLLSATGACRPGLGARFSRGLARFSYTLYVVHLPLCVLVAALVLGDARWYPTAAHLAAGAAILILLIGYACGVAWLTEFRTDRVRGWAESLLRREPA